MVVIRGLTAGVFASYRSLGKILVVDGWAIKGRQEIEQ